MCGIRAAGAAQSGHLEGGREGKGVGQQLLALQLRLGANKRSTIACATALCHCFVPLPLPLPVSLPMPLPLSLPVQLPVQLPVPLLVPMSEEVLPVLLPEVLPVLLPVSILPCPC